MIDIIVRTDNPDMCIICDANAAIVEVNKDGVITQICTQLCRKCLKKFSRFVVKECGHW